MHIIVQRKSWEDSIREWTGLQFGKSRRAVETGKNGENWLQNHLWYPNDPRGYRIDDNDDDEKKEVFLFSPWYLVLIKEQAGGRRQSHHVLYRLHKCKENA